MEQSSVFRVVSMSQSNKKILKDKMDRLAQSDSSISYAQLSRKSNKFIEKCGVGSQLVQTNKAVPRPPEEEINHLAKTWCELMLNQIQEKAMQTRVAE